MALGPLFGAREANSRLYSIVRTPLVGVLGSLCLCISTCILCLIRAAWHTPRHRHGTECNNSIFHANWLHPFCPTSSSLCKLLWYIELDSFHPLSPVQTKKKYQKKVKKNG